MAAEARQAATVAAASEDTLRAALEKLKEEHTSAAELASANAEKLQQSISDLERQRDMLINNLESEKHQLQSRIDELMEQQKSRAETVEQDGQRLEDEVQNLQNELRESQRKLAEEQEKAEESSRRSQSSQTAAIESAKGREDELQATIARLTEELEALSKSSDAKAKDSESQIVSLSADLEGVRQRLADREEKQAEYDADLKRAKMAIEESHAADIASWQAKHQALQQQVSEYEERLKQMEEQQESLVQAHNIALDTSESERMDVSQRLTAALHEHSQRIEKIHREHGAASDQLKAELEKAKAVEAATEPVTVAADVEERVKDEVQSLKDQHASDLAASEKQYADQIESLKSSHFRELQSIRNQANQSGSELTSLRQALKSKDDQIKSLKEQVDSMSEALNSRPYPLPPASPNLDHDHLDALAQKHELELSRAREKARKYELVSHEAQRKAHQLSKDVIDLQEQIAKLNTLVLLERDKAAKAMAEVFEMTMATPFAQGLKEQRSPGNEVNKRIPLLSPDALSPKSAMPLDLPEPSRLPQLSPSLQPLPPRRPSTSSRRGHGRSVSHAPTVHENVPAGSRSDFPSPIRPVSPYDRSAPLYHVTEATPDLQSDLPQFTSPFHNPSPFDGYAPTINVSHNDSVASSKISPKAKHARRQSLQMLQARIEDELGEDVLRPQPSAATSPQSGHLHSHYGLDAGTIHRLSKRASVGDELIWCAQCKGDLIII